MTIFFIHTPKEERSGVRPNTHQYKRVRKNQYPFTTIKMATQNNETNPNNVIRNPRTKNGKEKQRGIRMERERGRRSDGGGGLPLKEGKEEEGERRSEEEARR